MKDKKNIIIAILSGIIILGIGYMIGSRNQSKEVTDLTPQPTINESATSNSTKHTTTSTFKDVELTDKTSENNRNLPTELLPYSDEEIEYARVWLAVMGEDYLEEVGPDSQFKLSVIKIPKGEQLGYGRMKFDVTWPKDVIALQANATALGQIYYSSNFDGTVSVYTEMPSHWQLSQEDSENEEFMLTLLNKIKNTTKIVPIPAGNPTNVKEIIERIQ
ncbi:hypothetical protein JZO80_02745 [Vagococcus fluvialis]|uniref:hypothetical protein n=1 Tax=Vagococcus fluvialis TaxID=2738 RepID=UPI000A3315E6|nr:hypothetical protein [Vagococcus fluvialis]MBO0419067.1 hypothetical protein [Vagococcus fluvialis]OTP29489.1 hypothetical protein A5798_002657 [Enterococcus sp. 6C8_DIV0013]